MQALYLINKLTTRVAANLRKRQSDRLSAALARELALADPRMRADIEQLIARTTSTDTAAQGQNSDKAPSTTVSAPRVRGGFRTMPLPGLPTHMRYSSS